MMLRKDIAFISESEHTVKVALAVHLRWGFPVVLMQDGLRRILSNANRHRELNELVIPGAVFAAYVPHETEGRWILWQYFHVGELKLEGQKNGT